MLTRKNRMAPPDFSSCPHRRKSSSARFLWRCPITQVLAPEPTSRAPETLMIEPPFLSSTVIRPSSSHSTSTYSPQTSSSNRLTLQCRYRSISARSSPSWFPLTGLSPSSVKVLKLTGVAGTGLRDASIYCPMIFTLHLTLTCSYYL